MSIRAGVALVLVGCSHAPAPGSVEVDAPSGTDTTTAPTVTVERITDEHRAVPGAMFGGWGPHLGHLVHASSTLWVDDLCSATVAGDCDVYVDRRVGMFELSQGVWTRRATIPLTGVQENTATIEVGGTLYVYGVAGRNIVECTEAGCTTIPLDIGAGANYVGAAVVPGGSRVVWWTNVVDGGGGSFSYFVNYGGGWNGPRTGAVGGYNNCAYAHVAFDGATARWFCQVVSGLAPNWSYATLVGTTTQSLAAPVTWVNGLAPPAGDPIISTNDLYVDDTGGAHLLARSDSGGAVYYYAPPGGGYTQQAVIPTTYRARWIVGSATIALALDVNNHHGVDVRTATRASLPSGAFDIAAWPATAVPLPDGFGQLYAIYPLSPAYQDAAFADIELALVGSGDEHAAYHVAIR